MAANGSGIVRQAEWRRVRDFALSARTFPAVLALQGEAGAGKSTLWRGGVGAAQEAGHRVLRTEPSAGETDMSFAGLSDLLADVLPEVAAEIPAPQLEALEVALLLRSAGSQPPTAHAVGLAVLAALHACASRWPVLVAVDDVQWLDEASIEALAFAFRRITDGALTLLLAARTATSADPVTAGEPPPPSTWRSLLTALPAAEVIDLAPLDMWQIQNLLPGFVTTAQASLVARQSRGNPFWAKEILASTETGATMVPPLALSLTGRLSRSLSPAAADALAVVAAAGRIRLPEALPVLSHLDDPAAAVDDAVLAGLLIERADRIVVSHPLIAAAAVHALPPGRRGRLYRQLADASADPERRAHFAALAAGAARIRRSLTRWMRPRALRMAGPLMRPRRSLRRRPSPLRPQPTAPRWCAAGSARADCCSWPARSVRRSSSSRRSTSTGSARRTLSALCQCCSTCPTSFMAQPLRRRSWGVPSSTPVMIHADVHSCSRWHRTIPTAFAAVAGQLRSRRSVARRRLGRPPCLPCTVR